MRWQLGNFHMVKPFKIRFWFIDKSYKFNCLSQQQQLRSGTMPVAVMFAANHNGARGQDDAAWNVNRCGPHVNRRRTDNYPGWQRIDRRRCDVNRRRLHVVRAGRRTDMHRNGWQPDVQGKISTGAGGRCHRQGARHESNPEKPLHKIFVKNSTRDVEKYSSRE